MMDDSCFMVHGFVGLFHGCMFSSGYASGVYSSPEHSLALFRTCCCCQAITQRSVQKLVLGGLKR